MVLCSEAPMTLCDRVGLAYQDYGGEIGVKLNPLRTAAKGLDYHNEYLETENETAKQLFLNVANWIITESKSHGNYSLLEYNFHIQTIIC